MTRQTTITQGSRALLPAAALAVLAIVLGADRRQRGRGILRPVGATPVSTTAACRGGPDGERLGLLGHATACRVTAPGRTHPDVNAGRHGHDHAAQPADRGHRPLSRARRWCPTSPVPRPAARRRTPSPRAARHLPLRGRPAAQRPAPGRDGPVRRARRPARRRRARPTTAPRRRTTTRPSSSSARSTPRSTTPATRRRSTCASTRRATPSSTARRTPPPRRSRRPPASRCCCATSTPASSTTRWACSAPTRRSSPSTAARWTARAPLRGRDLRSRPDRRRPRHGAGRATDGQLAVYDASLTLHNTNTAGVGGMLTFIAVTGSGGGADTSGPATSGAPGTRPAP